MVEINLMKTLEENCPMNCVLWKLLYASKCHDYKLLTSLPMEENEDNHQKVSMSTNYCQMLVF
jgi:hypothetical protein